VALIDFYDSRLDQLELFITRQAKDTNSHSFYLLRTVPGIGKILARWEHKHGKAKALAILAHNLAHAVYFMLRREKAFDLTKFLTG